MHPDFSLVLQKCASNLSLKHRQSIWYLNTEASIMSCSTAESLHNSPKDENDDLVRIVSDEEDEEHIEEEMRSLNAKRLHLRANAMDHDDNVSICSELSVGQEHMGDETRSLRHGQQLEDEEILDISDTHSNSSGDERNNTPSTPGESPLNPFALANTLRFPVPFGLQHTPAVVAPTNISPFQEEFLRKSHLYAEELMKHQMQLMAAARASAFTMRSQSLHNASVHMPSATSLVHLNPLTKIGQISAAAAAAALSAAAQHSKPLTHNLPQHPTSLQQHHQHHAHHHAQNLHHSSSDTLAKLTALSKQSSSSSSHMLSTLNQLQTQMQAHLPGLLHDNNDNLHERALKFSIDNILKADFGRGQSPPPITQKKSHHSHSKSLTQRQKSMCSSSSSSASNNTVLSDSLDQQQNSSALGHGSIPPSAQAFSSSLASICTNSNDSNSTAVSSSYSSANGATDLIKSSPSQTPTLSPGLTDGGGGKGKSSTEEGAVTSTGTTGGGNGGPIVWPAWVYCTRYSDRPSSGPRVRKPKKSERMEKSNSPSNSSPGSTSSATTTAAASSSSAAAAASSSTEDKRPRTAFSGSQLARLKHEFNESRYLTEKRRQQLSSELGLNEAQIKIWFQNKRAKLKKSSGVKNPLALQLMAQGLYNHSTIPLTREEEELQELQERENANSNNNNNMSQAATSAVSS